MKPQKGKESKKWKTNKSSASMLSPSLNPTLSEQTLLFFFCTEVLSGTYQHGWQNQLRQSYQIFAWCKEWLNGAVIKGKEDIKINKQTESVTCGTTLIGQTYVSLMFQKKGGRNRKIFEDIMTDVFQV